MMHSLFLYMHKELGVDLGMIVKGPSPDDVSKVSTTFLIFFLVYYGGNCFSRYYSMYKSCMDMGGDVTRGTFRFRRREAGKRHTRARDTAQTLQPHSG